MITFLNKYLMNRLPKRYTFFSFLPLVLAGLALFTKTKVYEAANVNAAAPVFDVRQTITGCSGVYTDIGGEDGLYVDYVDNERYVWTYCPSDPGNNVMKLEFEDFDVHPGDIMALYDGPTDDPARLIINNLAGGAVSRMAGTTGPAYDGANYGAGWVQASCFNFTGCITMTFVENGDANKGEGWKFKTVCAPRSGVKTCGTPTIQGYGNCILGYTGHSWKAPTMSLCNRPVFLTLYADCFGGVRTEDMLSPAFPDTILADGATYDWYFTSGRYKVFAVLIGVDLNSNGIFDAGEGIDQILPDVAYRAAYQAAYTCTTQVNIVDAPLAGNDTITVSLNSQSCGSYITPDMVLEDPCTGFEGVPFEWGYLITVQTDNGQKLGGFNPETGAFEWPLITGEDVTCGKIYPYSIVRKTLYDKDCDGALRGVYFNQYASFDEFLEALLDPANYNAADGVDYRETATHGYIRFLDEIAPLLSSPETKTVWCFDLAGKTQAQIDNFLNSRGSINFNDIAEDVCGMSKTALGSWIRKELDCTEETYYVGGCERPVHAIYERTLSVEDACANGATAKQEIMVIQPAIQMPVCVELDCKQAVDVSPAALARIDAVFVPFVDPDNLCYTVERMQCRDSYQYAGFNDGDEQPAIDHASCGYVVSYEDQRVDICASEYKIFRRWTVQNWCTGQFETGSSEGSDGKEFIQIITVVDKGSFTVNIPERLDAKSIDEYCSTAYVLPIPQATGCSDVSSIVVTVNGKGEYKPGETVHLNAGPNSIIYKVKWCAYQASKEYIIEVVDLSQPIAICETFRQVSLTVDGTGVVAAQAFDDGSYDPCGPVYFKVIRMADLRNSPNGVVTSQTSDAECHSYNGDDDPSVSGNQIYLDDEIKFCCNDVNKTDLMVLLRVFDLDPGKGPVKPGRMENSGDLTGHFNDCMSRVQVVDKLTPMCMAPADITLDCADLPGQIDQRSPNEVLPELNELFGSPNTGGGCAPVIKELTPSISLNCGSGKIVRTFRAESADGSRKSLTCSQTITVTGHHEYWVRFPKDTSGSCGVVLADTTLEFKQFGCDLLTWTVKDQKFEAADGCYKVFRRFRVLNWCEWDKISPPIIISRDEDGDDKPGDEDVFVIFKPFEGGKIFIDKDLDLDNGHWRNIGVGSQLWRSHGYYEYTQILKVSDDVAPVVTAESVSVCDNTGDCEEGVTIPFTIVENCSPEDLKVSFQLKPFGGTAVNDPFGGRVEFISRDGNTAQYRITGGVYPVGKHKFVIRVVEGCGNFGGKEVEFEVKDCKGPNPICREGLSTELMNVDNGMAEIWVSDFIASPSYDCTGQGPELKDGLLQVHKYSINRKGSPRLPNQQALTYTCADKGFQEVEVWAYDDKGQFGRCLTYIWITDLDGFCPNPGAGMVVAGAITTEAGAPVENVEVMLSGNQTQMEMTTVEGKFAFDQLDSGYDYTVTPHKDDDPLNGITTYDLVMISKHVLRVEPFTNPYQLLAADVNKSGSISALDIVELRRMILRLDENFKNNTSWRFVGKDYQFANPLAPWAETFPEVASWNNLSEVKLNANFLAVKTGDVNATAWPNSQAAVEGRDDLPKWTISTDDRMLYPGEEVNITLAGESLENVEGFQFALQFDPAVVEWVHSEPGLLQQEHIGTRFASEGLIITSWDGVHAPVEKGKDELFTLVFKVKQNARLSQILSVGNQLVPSEAYQRSGEFKQVELSFERLTTGDELVLYQNRPNPFRESTLIGFRLPVDDQVTLRVMEMDGKVVRIVQGQYPAGYHEIELNLRDLPQSGVMIYQLETSQRTAVKKMVRID